MKISQLSLLAFATTWSLISAHTVITYPGWRGNNLRDTEEFPYGMQWDYPCGGMNVTTNRTNWPIEGGAIAIQPGWFQGHAKAYFYINMGYGTDFLGGPKNMSFPMLPVFEITGPSKEAYNGTFCLPHVPLPVNSTAKIGDNVTIQIVEVAVHGAALYNCVDVTLSDPKDVADVNNQTCPNMTEIIGFNQVYSTPGESSATFLTSRASHHLAWIPLLLVWMFAIVSS
ncbi:MAG: hypothetical protein M1837_006489 [Sclerophora amabilis]|nr:MAG: hypothetical protein M1837_006489 [Sclerophora amabilis]